MLEPPVNVCEPSRLNVVPVAPTNEPLLVPPPAKVNVPLCTSTVPSLWYVRPTPASPAPADLRKVPALLKVPAPPIPRSARTSHEAPAWLLITAPLLTRTSPPPQTAVP